MAHLRLGAIRLALAQQLPATNPAGEQLVGVLAGRFGLQSHAHCVRVRGLQLGFELIANACQWFHGDLQCRYHFVYMCTSGQPRLTSGCSLAVMVCAGRWAIYTPPILSELRLPSVSARPVHAGMPTPRFRASFAQG